MLEKPVQTPVGTGVASKFLAAIYSSAGLLAPTKLGWHGTKVDVLAVAFLLLSTTIRLATYDDFVDGPWQRHVGATVFGLVLASLVWLVLRIRLRPGSALPALGALVVLLAGDSVHVVRWLHPLSRSGTAVLLKQEFRHNALDPRLWSFGATGDGAIQVGEGQILLRNGPGTTAYVDLKLENIVRPRDRFAAFRNELLPVEVNRWPVRRLTWHASVSLDQQFYPVAEIPQYPLLIQAVPFGLHITYPDPSAGIVGKEVSAPSLNDGLPRAWTMERSPHRLAFYLDDELLWEGPAGPEPKFIRLGGSRVDSLHGGSMAISRVEYSVRRPDVS